MASNEGDMVLTEENSPITSKGRGNFLHGLGEHEERRMQLIAERRKEFKEQLDSATASLRNGRRREDKALSTSDLEGPPPEEVDSATEIGDLNGIRKRCNSSSTQTDPADVSSPVALNNSSEIKENGFHVGLSPQNQEVVPREIYYLSPREKLMYDLHGVSHCFPGISPKISPRNDIQDNKLRQAAYAKALQEQIAEKHRIEKEKKRKEKEEEELIEQRIRLQQEKIENDLNDEEKKKHDWLAQRQSHEEVLRRRMLELELEAQELKKVERRKKQEISEPKRDSLGSRPLPPPQPTRIEPSRSVANPVTNTPRHRESKFEGLRMAPLLDADRQNILATNGLLHSYSPKSTVSISNPNPRSKVIEASHDRERPEEILRAPLDFRIERSSSPPIPAVKTRGILNNNTKVLENKWEIPKPGDELKRTQIGSGRDNILTQLGAFRRQLHEEHVKLEARLQKQQSP